MYRNSIFELNDSGYVNLGPHDKWGQRSVEYALLTHKSTGKQIDHFNRNIIIFKKGFSLYALTPTFCQLILTIF